MNAVVDCKSDKVEAANCATRVIEKDKVVAIIGPSNSDTSLAITKLVSTSEIPAIVVSSTNPLITVDREVLLSELQVR